MGARVAYLVACLGLAACVYGCGGGGVPREDRAEWRDKQEAACLSGGAVRASAYVQAGSRISGASACSINTPLRVSGALGGRVAVTPTATVNCPLTAALDRWLYSSVQPAAQRVYGSPVVEIRQIASYSCRGRNGSRRGHLSEHAYGNAIDIAGFRFANGEEVTVVKGWWRGGPRERAFLREVFAGASREFYTVLGPGSDRHHYNHFHVDLLVTNAARGRHYCRPNPGSSGAWALGPSDEDTTASLGLIPFMGPSDH